MLSLQAENSTVALTQQLLGNVAIFISHWWTKKKYFAHHKDSTCELREKNKYFLEVALSEELNILMY